MSKTTNEAATMSVLPNPAASNRLDSVFGGATELCFNRADFVRADFNVERFINGARRRQIDVEQLQHDLRVYLRIIQNCMIELINDDYADFVNLSTSLVNLRAALDKLKTDVTQVHHDFATSTAQLSQVVADMGEYERQLQANVDEQVQLEGRLAVMNQLHDVQRLLRQTR